MRILISTVWGLFLFGVVSRLLKFLMLLNILENVRDVEDLNEESHKDQGNLSCERGTFLTLSPIASGIYGYSIVLLIFDNTSAFAAKFTGISLRAI